MKIGRGVAKAIRFGMRKMEVFPPFRTMRTDMFMEGNKSFRAPTIKLTGKQIWYLGVNPRHFKQGLKASFLPQVEFAECCRAKGYSDRTSIMGFYPVAEQAEMRDVVLGERDHLSAQSRRIVLPRAFDENAFTHEVLHDIFLGCFDAARRMSFYKCIAAWFVRVRDQGLRPEEEAFYHEVNRRAAEPYPLEQVRGKNAGASIRDGLFSSQFMHFAGECFAYGGELLIHGSDAEYLGRLPQEIRTYFKLQKIVPRMFF